MQLQLQYMAMHLRSIKTCKNLWMFIINLFFLISVFIDFKHSIEACGMRMSTDRYSTWGMRVQLVASWLYKVGCKANHIKTTQI